jgi:hypothetical protein
MGVTTITADPFCKEQNSAGFEEIIACSDVPRFVGKRAAPGSRFEMKCMVGSEQIRDRKERIRRR